MGLFLLLLFILSLSRLSLKTNQAHSLPFLLVTGCPDACLGQGDAVTFCFTIWHHAALQIF